MTTTLNESYAMMIDFLRNSREEAGYSVDVEAEALELLAELKRESIKEMMGEFLELNRYGDRKKALDTVILEGLDLLDTIRRRIEALSNPEYVEQEETRMDRLKEGMAQRGIHI